MKWIGSLALVLAVGVVGCRGPAGVTPEATEETAVADEPKPPAADGKDVHPALAEVFKERAKLHRRQTGALLTIAARWEKRPRGGPTGPGLAVVIDWSIDYDGPRHPFTVLNPSLSPSAAEQTTVHFWYVDTAGRAVPFQLAAGDIAGPWLVRPEDFSVAAGGKPVDGQLEVYEGGLAQRAGRRFRPGDVLLVQLEHTPRDRGDVTGSTLDAWTGRLWSQPVALTAVPSLPAPESEG
jgi:hypothetical protein